jgi:hypothetical protein
MTLLFSCFSQKQVVRMGLSPAWFPISSQRIGGEPERPVGELHKLSFFSIMIRKTLSYESCINNRYYWARWILSC